MKKLFKRLKDIEMQIKGLNQIIANAPSTPYYKEFGREKELERDLQEYADSMKDLLAYKLETLNKIEDACGVEILKLRKDATAA